MPPVSTTASPKSPVHHGSGTSKPPANLRLPVIVLASTLHDARAVESLTERVMKQMSGDGLDPCVAANSVETSETPAYLILTGGTENQALSAMLQGAGPYLLLAHPEHNSLPAAVEILAGLRQNGRRGRIVLIHDPHAARVKVRRFLRLAAAHRELSTMRLGLLGRPSDWLAASMVDPRWVKRRWGPEVVLIDMDDLMGRLEHLDPAEVARAAAEMSQGVAEVREPSPDDISSSSRFYIALRDIAQTQKLSGISVRCFDLVQKFKQTGCLALSRLIDEGCLGGCEGDLPALLTMVWLQAVSGDSPFMANPQDMDPDQNQLWLAHCTIARSWLSRCVLRSHFESGSGVGIQGTIDPGPITIARIGGQQLDEVMMFDGHLVGTETLETRCRTQIKVSLKGRVQEYLERPLGNHQVLIRGAWRADLEEYLNLFAPISGDAPAAPIPEVHDPALVSKYI